jgi:UPF0176 protein
MFKVVIFYKYVVLENPEAIMKQIRSFGERIGIKGRILLGKEGINATAGGTEEQVIEFTKEMQSIPEFADIDLKYSDSEKPPFPKLKIKVREEIVSLGPDAAHIDMSEVEPGVHITAQELEELYEKEEDFVVLDARNDYESKIGKFKDSITPDIENFRDLPKFLQENKDKVKDKKVVFVCTSGVRCEKATAYAKSIGYEEIYQLNGGMQRYLENYPSSNFEGSLYVFDDRIAIAYDKSPDRQIISECLYCKIKTDSYKNCFNAKCNARIVVCDECFRENDGCCSEDCKKIKHPRKVEFRFSDVLENTND